MESFLRSVFLAGWLSLLLSGSALAAPSADAWEFWGHSDESSVVTIDHQAWQTFLDRYLVPREGSVNVVRYGSVSKPDLAMLKNYLAALQALDPRRYNKAEQKAYWINLYNAATVALVVEHYPVESIREIRSGWFSFGPWDQVIGKVVGEELTLNDIEHRILRPLFNDPLIHFGLNCASIGCPDLIRQTYSAANVDALLKENAEQYLASSRGVRFAGRKLILSSIFDWFSEDFGGEQGVLRFVARQGPARFKGLADFEGRISYAYDWALNDAR